MPATTNVVSFSLAREKIAAKKATAVPATSQWDRDYEEVGGPPAYKLHQVLQGACVAYLKGDTKMGDRLIAACKAEGFDDQILLDREVGEYFLAVDLTIAINGEVK